MRLNLWSRRRDREEELDAELRSHLEMAVQERLERGETQEEAEAAVRREFGNVVLVKEVTRQMWGWVWLEELIQDLKYGVRSMRRAPGFTVVAVLTLGLGIGANTAIFSLVNAILLRQLPFKNPEQLVTGNPNALTPASIRLRSLTSLITGIRTRLGADRGSSQTGAPVSLEAVRQREFRGLRIWPSLSDAWRGSGGRARSRPEGRHARTPSRRGLEPGPLAAPFRRRPTDGRSDACAQR